MSEADSSATHDFRTRCEKGEVPGHTTDGKWKPGYCPNPGGRPKSAAGFRQKNREIAIELAERIAELAASVDDVDGAETVERMSKAMATAAKFGGFPSIGDILNAARARQAFPSEEAFNAFIDRVMPPEERDGYEESRRAFERTDEVAGALEGADTGVAREQGRVGDEDSREDAIDVEATALGPPDVRPPAPARAPGEAAAVEGAGSSSPVGGNGAGLSAGETKLSALAAAGSSVAGEPGKNGHGR